VPAHTEIVLECKFSPSCAKEAPSVNIREPTSTAKQPVVQVKAITMGARGINRFVGHADNPPLSESSARRIMKMVKMASPKVRAVHARLWEVSLHLLFIH
jgi:3-polyprenyl-4-hydroxybenzoate decarboxylase